jgi:uncharacterized protein YdeI (YjbR/CyaY-like superfamily)
MDQPTQDYSDTKEIDIKAGVVHEVPDDLKTVLLANSELLTLWNKLTPIQRNEWICWVTIVKTEKTRIEHLERLSDDILQGKRKPCCWPGCPHRNLNAAKWFK